MGNIPESNKYNGLYEYTSTRHVQEAYASIIHFYMDRKVYWITTEKDEEKIQPCIRSNDKEVQRRIRMIENDVQIQSLFNIKMAPINHLHQKTSNKNESQHNQKHKLKRSNHGHGIQYWLLLKEVYMYRNNMNTVNYWVQHLNETPKQVQVLIIKLQNIYAYLQSMKLFIDIGDGLGFHSFVRLEDIKVDIGLCIKLTDWNIKKSVWKKKHREKLNLLLKNKVKRDKNGCIINEEAILIELVNEFKQYNKYIVKKEIENELGIFIEYEFKE